MRKGYVNFREAVKARGKCKKELQHFLTQMSKIYYDHENHRCEPKCTCSDIFHKGFRSIIVIEDKTLDLLIRPNETAHPMNYYYFMDELTSLLQQSQR